MNQKIYTVAANDLSTWLFKVYAPEVTGFLLLTAMLTVTHSFMHLTGIWEGSGCPWRQLDSSDGNYWAKQGRRLSNVELCTIKTSDFVLIPTQFYFASDLSITPGFYLS